MITRDLFDPGLAARDPAARRLMDDPSWRWGNPFTGDPLTRADDKALGALGPDRDATVGRLAGSLRDPATRAEIRLRGQHKVERLSLQLVELRRFNLPALEREAEQELADQQAFVVRFSEDEAPA